MFKKYFYTYFIFLIVLSFIFSINFSISEFDNNCFWPTPESNNITSYFGFRTHPVTGKYSSHSGIDIAVPEGNSIYSICDGYVNFIVFNVAYGYSIIVKNSNYEILYAHVSPNYIININQNITKGDLIGNIGPKYVNYPSKYTDSSRKIYKWIYNRSSSSFNNKKRRHSRQSFRFFLNYISSSNSSQSNSIKLSHSGHFISDLLILYSIKNLKSQ